MSKYIIWGVPQIKFGEGHGCVEERCLYDIQQLLKKGTVTAIAVPSTIGGRDETREVILVQHWDRRTFYWMDAITGSCYDPVTLNSVTSPAQACLHGIKVRLEDDK